MSLNIAPERMERALADRTRHPAADLLASTSPASAWSRDHVLWADWPAVNLVVAEALRAGETHYTSRPGLPELRKAVVAAIQSRGGDVTAVDEVVITSGAQESRYVLLHTLAAEGAGVALVEPAHPGYAQVLRQMGAAWTAVPAGEDGCSIDTGDLQRLPEQTGVVVLSSPSILTGGAFTAERLSEIMAALAGRTVIWDESLIGYRSAGDRLHPAQFAGSDTAVWTLGSLAAPFGLEGWRIGYFAAPGSLVPPARSLKQALSVCTASLSQYAALATIRMGEERAEELRRRLRQHRDRLAESLSAAGHRVIEGDIPYVVVRPASQTQLPLPGLDASCFGKSAAGLIRLTVPSDPADLDRAVNAINSAGGAD